jgi:uncharacterized protein (TIGR02453 family)
MPEPTGSAKFTPQLFVFLRELQRNNNRPWFLKNKSRYERDVLRPCLGFIEAMAPQVGRINSHLVADARPVGGSLTRIYRDIRFSRDKSPYRAWVGIHFHHEGRAEHDGGLPGFFLRLAPGESFVAAGMWMPPPRDLTKIRKAIVKDSAKWSKARAAGLRPDESALKRVPPGFDPESHWADDLRRKSFVARSEFEDSEVAAPAFTRRFVSECQRMDPLNRFLATATGVPY